MIKINIIPLELILRIRIVDYDSNELIYTILLSSSNIYVDINSITYYLYDYLSNDRIDHYFNYSLYNIKYYNYLCIDYDSSL